MGTNKHNEGSPVPQADEDDPATQLDYDLYSLGCSIRTLLESPLLHPLMRNSLGTMLRSLRGCRSCGHMLGDLHGGSCPTGGIRVVHMDLDYSEPAKPPQNAPQGDSAAF